MSKKVLAGDSLPTYTHSRNQTAAAAAAAAAKKKKKKKKKKKEEEENSTNIYIAHQFTLIIHSGLDTILQSNLHL